MRFPFRLPSFCPPLTERIRRAANDPKTQIVEMGSRYGEGHAISPEKIFTYQVFNCNVVTLFAGDLVGMSHYPGHTMKPKSYLPQFIDEISRQSGTSEISAVPVAGDEFYHDEVKEILTDRRVRILGEFCDDLETCSRHEFENAFFHRRRYGRDPQGYEGITEVLGEKFVLAIPDTREVLMYSSATNVGSLTLTPLTLCQS